ncbi:MAG TPA: copper-containing nitrite reductase [Xanthobacteraceae bacterium]|jgi:nitrite reductase (NO-forming)
MNILSRDRLSLFIAAVMASLAITAWVGLLPASKAAAPTAQTATPASTPLAAAPATRTWTPIPASANAPLAHTKTALAAKADGPVNIVRDPADLPKPLAVREPRRVRVDLETTEVTGTLADGATYGYWTFNGKVPGPFVRVRVGDVVEVRLKNHEDSAVMHNVDFHAVTGPGGGAVATEAPPGESRGFDFRALNPGLYVYHCAIPMAAQHIANGMYGMILVEPEGGLPKVDREFYIMQGEIYTEQPFGTKGALTESHKKLLDERPEYFVFNGAVGALSAEKPLKANVGETVRIFFGVGGPNFTSSFHVIGEIFDRLYNLASLTAPPLRDVQTATVPPGGAAVVEFKVEIPGKYIIVDHALSRVNRGLVGVLEVTGPGDPNVFRDHEPAKSADSKSH